VCSLKIRSEDARRARVILMLANGGLVFADRSDGAVLPRLHQPVVVMNLQHASQLPGTPVSAAVGRGSACLSTHKTQAVRTFLLEHPNVHLHFTPTYSSWLNHVELWFSKIERDLLARHRRPHAVTG